MSFRDHARRQARSCAALGSPFTARLLGLMADHLRPGHAVADRLLGWPADRLDDDAVALRLAAALHHLVLSGQAPVLARLYNRPEIADAQLWRAVEAALRLKAPAVLHTLDRPPQTNEVGRSAVFIAAGHWLSAAFRLPLVLSEPGACAGLNLMWDHYALQLDDTRYGPDDAALVLSPDWHGALPPRAAPVIRARAGVDATPLDPVADRARLQSYLWPDQPAALARQAAALDIAAEHAPDVAQGDAVDWLAERLARPLPQACHMVFHSLTWQYLPEHRQRAAIDHMASARLREDEPLAHVAMEDDGTGPGAAVTLTLWPEGREIPLGRADFHGAWVDWQAPAIDGWTDPRR